MSKIGVPNVNCLEKLRNRSTNGRPTSKNAARNSNLALHDELDGLTDLIRNNIHCDLCKKCFSDRKKLDSHKRICPKKRDRNTKKLTKTKANVSPDDSNDLRLIGNTTLNGSSGSESNPNAMNFDLADLNENDSITLSILFE